MTHPETQDVVSAAGALLRTRRIGRVYRVYETVSSTNTVASAWAEDGAADGAVVYAEYQTQGRGRMGRTWHARAGLNLTFSIVLRPPLAPDHFGLIGIAAGLAVAEAVERFTLPLPAAIRWPNDVLLSGRKCCGILLETRWSAGDQPSAVVLGIGLNVNQAHFPEEIDETATSLMLETGRPQPREDVLAAVLNALEEHLVGLPRDAATVREAYLARMSQLEMPVKLRFAGGGTVAGIARGLDDSGGLILETARGDEVFHAGEVTHIP